MTTHFWAERAYKQWKLEINYDSTLDVEPIKIEEWILLIHGTKTSPYIYQDPTDASSKLSVAKNIHIHDFNDQHKYTSYLKNDNQKRVGDDPYSKI
ncbi:hypothetical protein GJ496_011309 [Pomphorhynchus laevis]|nr:hypothetical protein GJ496_011309 [Pomphorhynchus laevis]